MKVLCVIDNLASGGAQRQMVTLAAHLKKSGIDISFLTYHPHDFFLPILRAAEIPYTCLNSGTPHRHVFEVRRFLRHGDQDVVLAFQRAPSVYAELAGLPRRRWGLVVSERLAKPASHRFRARCLRKCHYLADYVTTNSHTTRLIIERDMGRGIASRLVTVYNAVDLDTFVYCPPPPPDNDGNLRIAVAASYKTDKNPVGFVRAIALARAKRPDLRIQVDWYGDSDPADTEYHLAELCINEHGLRDCVRLHGPTLAIGDVYRNSDVVAMPSFFEGVPNAVCEAMASGRPILISNVCDAGNLVKNGENGFLFDPWSVDDTAESLLLFADLSAEQRKAMGRNSHQKAKRMFDPSVSAARYAKILAAAAARTRIPIEHWVPEVPESSYSSLNERSAARR